MHWKHSTCHILLSGSLCFFGVGCAAMNAIVSSPAGNSAAQRSPERMAAIGRVFENQGKYTQAQAMYRKALSSDPNSQIANERLNAIATMNSKRSFDPTTQKPTTESLLAVADALNGADRKPKRLGSGPKATPLLRTVEPIQIATPQAEALEASLVSPANDFTLPIVDVPSLTVPDLTEAADVETMGGLTLANPGWQLDESIGRAAEDSAGMPRSLDPTHELPEISTVVFEGSQDGVATIATTDDSWKSSNRTVSLEEVLEWYDSPAANADNLLFALTAGENDAVKAFAATLLAECPVDNPEINATLRLVDVNASAMLRVSSRDTLIQRGDIDDVIVNGLLNLLVDSDPNVQSQAAASLRNVAGTQWASQCVTQLTGMLSDGNPRVETVAAATLGDFGADAVYSRSVLMDVAANRADESTRAAAELALNRIPVADLTLPTVDFSADDQSEDDQFEPVISVDGYLPIVE